MFAELFIDLRDALGLLGEWQVILLLCLGTVVGLIFGAMPGIGAIQAMVLSLPFTFGMALQKQRCDLSRKSRRLRLEAVGPKRLQ